MGARESEGYTTDGYSSGALVSDEDIGDTALRQSSEPEFDPTGTKTASTSKRSNGEINLTESFAPSTLYSDGDYEVLCTTCPQTSSKQPILGPVPHERSGKCDEAGIL